MGRKYNISLKLNYLNTNKQRNKIYFKFISHRERKNIFAGIQEIINDYLSLTLSLSLSLSLSHSLSLSFSLSIYIYILYLYIL